MQLQLDFTTGSPINVEKLSRQNREIYSRLSSGQTVTVFDAIQMDIFHLHSRIAEIRKFLRKNGITLYDRMAKVKDIDCKEYSLTEFNQQP